MEMNGRVFEQKMNEKFEYNKDLWKNLTPYVADTHKQLSGILRNEYNYNPKKILSAEINPDYVFLSREKQQVVIYEVKYIKPGTSGSVDEKIQTAPYKLFKMKELFNYFFNINDIQYYYILNEEFWNQKKFLDSFKYLDSFDNLGYLFYNIEKEVFIDKEGKKCQSIKVI